MKNVIVSMVALAGIASGAMAQGTLAEANGGRLTFQVWNGSSWSSTIEGVNAGQTVQVRAVVSYIGSNTSVSALGGITYQPTFSNADNTGTGAAADQLGTWRNSGNQGNAIANSMLSAAEGGSGDALATGYGRVTYGGTAMNTSSQSTITTFRHGGGSPQGGAPAGSWLRVAGSSVSTWPLAALPAAGDATATNLNNINRGMFANQQSAINPITNLPNTFHVAGTQNLVIFRAAITIGDQLDRVISISTAAGTLQRFGGVNNADDLRYMSWQTAATDAGSWRVGVTVEEARINVVPTPATAALLGLGGLVAARRRRA